MPINFGDHELTTKKLITEIAEDDSGADISGADSTIDSSSCVILTGQYGSDINVYALTPNGRSGEIKTIHNMTSPNVNVFFYNEYNLDDGDILTTNGTNFLLYPYGSVTLQFLYDGYRGYNVWKIIGYANTQAITSS